MLARTVARGYEEPRSRCLGYRQDRTGGNVCSVRVLAVLDQVVVRDPGMRVAHELGNGQRHSASVGPADWAPATPRSQVYCGGRIVAGACFVRALAAPE